MPAMTNLQEKFKITGTHKGETVEFGPFDTKDKADKTVPALVSAGYTDPEVKVIYTCSSVAVFLRENAPKPEATDGEKPAEEAKPEPEAEVEKPKAQSAGRNGRSGRNAG